jgi:hypothetical protein
LKGQTPPGRPFDAALHDNPSSVFRAEDALMAPSPGAAWLLPEILVSVPILDREPSLP